MDAQRLDLSPNRWMAAGGLAFIHVRVWKGWMALITAAPVRDAIVGRAEYYDLPRRPGIDSWTGRILLFIALLIVLFPDAIVMLWRLFVGTDAPQNWTLKIILLAAVIVILLARIWRRGTLGIFLSDEPLDFLNRAYFNATQAKDPKILAFRDYLMALKAEAGDGKRKARTYILLPRWVSIVSAAMFMLLIGVAVRYRLAVNGVNHPEIYGALAAFLVSGIILLLSPKLSELFNGVLRRAHSCLLAGDAEGAANIVQPILDTNPKHRYANRLLTLARLMQCDLERTEALVIKRRTPGPYDPSLYHRIMDYKLWESRHADP